MMYRVQGLGFPLTRDTAAPSRTAYASAAWQGFRAQDRAGWVVLSALLLLAFTSTTLATSVHVRLIEADTGQVTPAMICITGKTTGEIRLPPDGEICEKPSRTDTFYKGVDFRNDRNWIGPVRKTMGRGDNDDRAFVYELRPSIPYWTEPVMYQVSGDFTIDLPAGDWRIAVERGMEHIPVVDEFTLDGSQDAIDKTIELKRWVDLKKLGWWSGDVHVHHPMLKPEHQDYLLAYAEAEDLHVLNLLEMGHHKGTDFKQEGFGPKFRVNRGDYWLVPGQEEPRSNFGHIIGLNLDSLVRVEDMKNYDFYDLVFEGIHEQDDALVGFAHFAWNGCALPRGFPWYVTTGELDFIELMQFTVVNAVDYYDYLNLGFRLSAAAGSDIPWGSTIGEVRTYVHTGEALDIDAWFAGLEAGHTFVSNGPALTFTVDGRLPGSEITKNKGETVKIAAKAWGHPAVGKPMSLKIVDNDGVVKEGMDQGNDLSLEIEVPVERSRWIAASVVCDNQAVAHTTPVYVIVDNQPTWCPKRGPIVIDKQLKEINKIAWEFPRHESDYNRQIHERLDKAKAFYADLRKKMLDEPE